MNPLLGVCFFGLFINFCDSVIYKYMLGSIIFACFAGLYGFVIGSYTNVLGLRKSFLKSFSGRSTCPFCKNTLKWYMLFPIFSYLFQKRKCLYCKKYISPQYIVVEFVVGVLYFLTAFIFFLSPLAIVLYITIPIFIAIIISDIKNFYIPNNLLYSLVISALIYASYIAFSTGSFTTFYSAILLLLPFALISFFTNERAMGWGDSYIAFAIGLIAGTHIFVLHIFFYSFWIGTICVFVYATYMRIKKGKWGIAANMKIPFAPYLIASFFLIIFGADLVFLL